MKNKLLFNVFHQYINGQIANSVFLFYLMNSFVLLMLRAFKIGIFKTLFASIKANENIYFANASLHKPKHRKELHYI